MIKYEYIYMNSIRHHVIRIHACTRNHNGCQWYLPHIMSQQYHYHKGLRTHFLTSRSFKRIDYIVDFLGVPSCSKMLLWEC